MVYVIRGGSGFLKGPVRFFFVFKIVDAGLLTYGRDGVADCGPAPVVTEHYVMSRSPIVSSSLMI